MSKFNTNKRNEGKPERGAFKPRAARKEKEGTSGKDEKSAGYKAKRSFTKNKSFRDVKDTKYNDKPKRSFGSSDERKTFKKDFDKSKPYNDRPKRSFDSNEKKPFKKEFGGEREPQGDDRPRRSFDKPGELKPYSDRPKRSFDSDEKKSFRKEFGGERNSRSNDKPKRSFDKPSDGLPFKREYKKSPNFESPEVEKKRRFSKPRKDEGGSGEVEKRYSHKDFEDGRSFSGQVKHEGYRDKKAFKKVSAPPQKKSSNDGLTRLNKYLSNAGVASRRDADILIQGGTVKVNGVVVDQLGYKIKPGDKVTYGDAAVKSERKMYLLLNKPKDYITTVDDPQERKTVMELIKGACKERLYPVGRLDRNTTGLLLFTNDGDMTTKLTHPKFGVKKIYHVSLNKGLKAEHFKAMIEGVELEDGMVKADDLAFVGEGKKEVGIEIHSGRNRIVRRLFEHLGYEILKLDRVVFAGLTKKELPRGKHRFLTAKEISFLQMIG